MHIQLPQEFIVRREMLALQDFGRSLLERIGAGEVILAKHRVAKQRDQWPRMIEVVWHERPYLIYERDLTEQAEPVGQTKEGPPRSMFAS